MTAGAARAMATARAVLIAVCAWASLAEAAFVRANCRGVQEFSTSESEVSCRESSVLSDDAEHLLLGHTWAVANLGKGRLSTSAAGGQIRDVGSNGGEAGALLMDRLTIVGDWQDDVAVTVHLCVAYKFAGFGDSRIHATLRSSSGDGTTGRNQARVRVQHRGFGGTALADFDSRGTFTIPPQGPLPAHAVFELTVTERVHHSSPTLNLRADLAAYALPNLEVLEPVLSSFAEVVGWLAVSLPEALAFTSESGMFLSEPGATGPKPVSDASWGIIERSVIGGGDALRNHRGWNRAAARSDCRFQLGVDG